MKRDGNTLKKRINRDNGLFWGDAGDWAVLHAGGRPAFYGHGGFWADQGEVGEGFFGVAGRHSTARHLPARAVRSHWGIENSWHWVLEVSLQEDRSRTRSGYAAENLALLRKLDLNLLCKNSSKGAKSINAKQLIAALAHHYLQNLLSQKF